MRKKWQWLDTLTRYVFDLTHKTSQRSKPRGERRRFGYRAFRRIVPVICSVGLVFLFLFAGTYYSTTQTRIENAPLVTNLTQKKVGALVRFGESPLCDGAPCWTSETYDDSEWTATSLPLDPNKSINSLPGYKKGLDAGWMYYRIAIPISKELLASKHEISFTPLFIQHQKYFVFLNGRLIFSGDGVALGSIANFPIPREDVHNGVAQFAIKATVFPDDVGIAHYHSALVGPKPVLDQAYLFNQHSQYTYYLLFMLTKGAIFVIFSLFFLYTRGQPGFLNFLVYGFFATIENLFIGDFLYGDELLSLNQRVLAFYSCKAIALSALLMFFINFFQARRLQAWGYLAGTVMVAATAFMAYDFAWGSKTISYDSLWAIINNSTATIIVFAIALGSLAIRRWKIRGAEGQQLKTYATFTGFLSVYLILVIEEFYFKTYVGFDKRALLDLGFFIVLALITARDMGFKEGRLQTLEGHMEEKRRMELELQEAAEIAKAFLPTSTPSWKRVDIETFHRPLTESSGDWYTFEQSANQQYFHFVMCDITGHGVQAAIVVSTCKSVFGSLVRSSPDAVNGDDFIARYARDLNATLYENGAGYHVSTLLGLTFEPEARRLHFISAGHPPPLLVRRDASGEWKPQALVSRNSVLGIHPKFEGSLCSVDFTDADQLITYTDGLPLGSNIQALKAFLREYSRSKNQLSAANLKDRIWAAEAARTRHSPADDISIVWFKGVA